MSMIFLVLGPDTMMVQEHVAQLVSKFDPAGDNTTRLDGKSLPMSQAITVVGTPGFFGETRLILIEDLLARATKGRQENNDTTGEKRGRSNANLDLAPLFAAVAPSNILIISDASLASVPASIRKILPDTTEIFLGDPPRGNQLISWVQHVAKRANSSISPRAARTLVELLFPQYWQAKPSNPRYDRPPDMELLRNEVEKLAVAAHPNPITEQQVKALTEAGQVDRLIPFLEAAAAGQLSRAMIELQGLLDNGDEIPRITAQLAQQLEMRAVLDEARGIDPVKVGSAIGLSNPNRMIGVARSPRGGASERAVDYARSVDQAVKRGELRDPLDALYVLLTHLAENAQNAKAPRGAIR